jgi:tol-pal system protein YbgF
VSDLSLPVQKVPASIQQPSVDPTGFNPPEKLASAVPVIQSDAFSELQLLRAEVQELRGLVETLNFRLQQVKQQQLDDYLDLDRRIVITSENRTDVTTAQTGRLTQGQRVPPEQSPAETSSSTDDEAIKLDYDRASTLLLKQRDMDGAVVAFNAHIERYPASPYLANASYWLGEIYLLKGLDEEARQEFSRIVEQHSGHSKEMDARFKLGKIYHQLGESSRARELLEVAAASSGAVSSKAKSYLEDNF